MAGDGELAQLVERCDRTAEVRGSSPLFSILTPNRPDDLWDLWCPTGLCPVAWLQPFSIRQKWEGRGERSCPPTARPILLGLDPAQQLRDAWEGGGVFCKALPDLVPTALALGERSAAESSPPMAGSNLSSFSRCFFQVEVSTARPGGVVCGAAVTRLLLATHLLLWWLNGDPRLPQAVVERVQAPEAEVFVSQVPLQGFHWLPISNAHLLASETTELAGFVGGEGSGVDAEGVVDGIGEPLAQTADHQGFRLEGLEPACVHHRKDSSNLAASGLDGVGQFGQGAAQAGHVDARESQAAMVFWGE